MGRTSKKRGLGLAQSWVVSAETADGGTTRAEERGVKRRAPEARDQQRGLGVSLGARGREVRGGRKGGLDHDM